VESHSRYVGCHTVLECLYLLVEVRLIVFDGLSQDRWRQLVPVLAYKFRMVG